VSEIKTIPAGRFLYNSGLLFEINRRILHPLGLALAINYDDQDGALSEEEAIITLSQDMWDYRDDPEGMIFADDSLEEGSVKYKRFFKEFAEQKILERTKLLGYTIQSLNLGETTILSPLTQSTSRKKGRNRTPKVPKPTIKLEGQEKKEEVSDDEIAERMKKNATMRTPETKSILDKVKVLGEGKEKPTEVIYPSDSDNEDKPSQKRIKQFIGTEHPRLGTGGKCKSTKENTTYTPIPGGSGIYTCTSCGATLRDPEIEHD